MKGDGNTCTACPSTRRADAAGKEIRCVAGVSQARLGCDLLLSRREIADFEASDRLGSAFDCQGNLPVISAHDAAWVGCERRSQLSKEISELDVQCDCAARAGRRVPLHGPVLMEAEEDS